MQSYGFATFYAVGVDLTTSAERRTLRALSLIEEDVVEGRNQ